MHTFLQALILGILTGGVYALMSTGQTLVFGVMRVVNVAQGMLVILSAYLSYTVHQDLGIDPFATHRHRHAGDVRGRRVNPARLHPPGEAEQD